MRQLGYVCVIVLAAGCQPPPAPDSKSDPASAAPATFATWPRVTAKPLSVGPMMWYYCRAPTPAELEARAAQAKLHGPHDEFTIVVRVSPEAEAAFRAGQPLPVGAVVVKEKYTDAAATGPLHGYAVMTKRPAGFFPDGGDWEYTFINLEPTRQETRGPLATCANCHATAKTTDFLFRSYGDSSR